MDIKDAYKLTNTSNPNQLAAAVGVSHTAAYKWRDQGYINESSESKVLKAAGLWPYQSWTRRSKN